MRILSQRSLILFGLWFSLAAASFAQPDPGGNPASVQYNPQEKVVQGNQPLDQNYPLEITAPSNLTPGVPVTINLQLSVLAKPASGVTDGQALSFITLTPSTLTFTGPSQKLTTTVAVAVPMGNFAGEYAYKILPSGWPLTTDGITDAGATVNAIASPPGSTDTTTPTVTLTSPVSGTSYTYRPATGSPVTVAINFSATVGTAGQPVDSMLATISGPAGTLPVSISAGTLPSFSATATGSTNLTTPGNYTVTVGATNRFGTSYASSDFSIVVDAPPPSITVTAPAASSTYSYTLGGAGASVPLSFSATSVYGNITALTATLDGNPVALNLTGVNAALTASGSATLTVPVTGSHSLVLSAANAFGPAQSVTIPFTVTGTVPAPTVAILAPVAGTTFTRAAGDPPTVVNYQFQGATAYGTIASAVVSVDGTPVSATVNGINTASVTGSGSLSYSAGGAHTINVTLYNSGGAQASASSSFTVQQTQPQTCLDLIWLPPVSLNKTVEGGSTVPIKFTLECKNKFVRDTSVLIAIYEMFRDGSASDPVVHPYGGGSPNPPDYAITGKQYHLNFATAKGTHSYRIEVYSSASGSLQLLGSKELNTARKKSKGGHGDDDNDRDCDRDDDHDDRNDRDGRGDHDDRNDRDGRGRG